MQNIWDVYIQELSFVPREVRDRLRTACNTDDVRASWQVWSKEAEASLVRACHTAEGPALAGPSSLSLHTRRLGPGARIESIALTMPMSLMLPTGFSVNSSLAPVLRFRRRIESVCNVLKDI